LSEIQLSHVCSSMRFEKGGSALGQLFRKLRSNWPTVTFGTCYLAYRESKGDVLWAGSTHGLQLWVFGAIPLVRCGCLFQNSRTGRYRRISDFHHQTTISLDGAIQLAHKGCKHYSRNGISTGVELVSIEWRTLTCHGSQWATKMPNIQSSK
jgi:hypothetical protein